MDQRPGNPRGGERGELQRSWAELCCLACNCLQLSWPRTVLSKWLNAGGRDYDDFSADEDVESDVEIHCEDELYGRKQETYKAQTRGDRLVSNVSIENAPFRLWRKKSETLRARYINTKELRICVGTWNVGGRFPHDDIEIEDWLDIEEPADIYVIGFQEIIPLNAGNVFGVEDSQPIRRWEYIIRKTLNRIQPVRMKSKCHSNPPPTRFKYSDDAPVIDETCSETDSDDEGDACPLDSQTQFYNDKDACIASANDSDGIQAAADPDAVVSKENQRFLPLGRRLPRVDHLDLTDYDENMETSVPYLTRALSCSERIGLSWPEQSLNLSPHQNLGFSNPSKDIKSLGACRSFVSSFEGNKLNTVIHRRKRSAFVRIVSKQMVGIFLSIWVRRSLRKHIQNLKVAAVGVGIMGYFGNKGSISVSMSIYQTLVCVICGHLTSGEKDGDELRRNADMQEIFHRTLFNTAPDISLPRTIHDHERIILLGDLNYRINLSYDKTLELIFRKEWPELIKMDQLKCELKKGRVFDGWTEGLLDFPPTYKYEIDSEKYVGEDLISERRTPAWCDRILAFGRGMKLLKYKRSEIYFSDHRPVTAVFMAEVEVFCHRKLRRSLTVTDAEIDCVTLTDIDNSSTNI